MLTIAAAVLLFLCLFIAVPAPTLWLLPLAVGAPELSPWLLAAALILILLQARGTRVRKIALLFSLAAAALAAMPLSRLPATVRAFDREMAAFAAPAPDALARMRPHPITAREFIRGIETGDARVDRGIRFAMPDGTPLLLDVYRPLQPGRYPALVQIYGGAWQRGSRGGNETFARYFAHRGYVVFAIEYRHAPVRQWPAQIEDVRSALAWIRAQGAAYEADLGRLAIVGRSAGAQLALVAAFTAEPRPAAVVNFYGPTDLAGGWNDPPDPDPISVREVLETFLGGTPGALPERYREASPVTHAAAGPPASLHIYGSRDHVVLPRFGRELHEQLRALGSTSVLLEIPWAGHAFDELPNGVSGQLALYYTERFLEAALRER